MNAEASIRCPNWLLIWVTGALGLLATVNGWVIYGWMAGVPTAIVSAVLMWRAFHTGFSLDARGLTVRSFVPGRDRILPWDRIRGLNLDVITTGTNANRSRRKRMRVFVDGGPTPMLVGFGDTFATQVIERFVARGLPTSDDRA